MKRTERGACFAALCLASLTLALTQTANAAYQGPNRSKLRIGAYFLRVKPVVTEAHVRDLKECGIDFVFDKFNAKYSRAEFDLYAKYGIGAVVTWVIPGKPSVPGTMRDTLQLSVYDKVSRDFRSANRMHKVIETLS